MSSRGPGPRLKSRVEEATDYETQVEEPLGLEAPATPRVIDFAAAARRPDPKRHGRIIDERDNTPEGLALTKKRVRARARRAVKNGKRLDREVLDTMWKPIEEWDMEELARGRPRAADGTFRGMAPSYVTREVHEAAMEQFKKMVRSGMNAHTVDALQVIGSILNNDMEDRKGRPMVPASTRLDAAKFLVEHVLGKAVQPTTTDISAKLQLILSAAMVNPGDDDEAVPQLEGYKPAHVGTRGPASDDDDIEDAEIVDWGDDE